MNHFGSLSLLKLIGTWLSTKFCLRHRKNSYRLWMMSLCLKSKRFLLYCASVQSQTIGRRRTSSPKHQHSMKSCPGTTGVQSGLIYTFQTIPKQCQAVHLGMIVYSKLGNSSTQQLPNFAPITSQPRSSPLMKWWLLSGEKVVNLRCGSWKSWISKGFPSTPRRQPSVVVEVFWWTMHHSDAKSPKWKPSNRIGFDQHWSVCNVGIDDCSLHKVIKYAFVPFSGSVREEKFCTVDLKQWFPTFLTLWHPIKQINSLRHPGKTRSIQWGLCPTMYFVFQITVWNNTEWAVQYRTRK